MTGAGVALLAGAGVAPPAVAGAVAALAGAGAAAADAGADAAAAASGAGAAGGLSAEPADAGVGGLAAADTGAADVGAAGREIAGPGGADAGTAGPGAAAAGAAGPGAAAARTAEAGGAMDPPTAGRCGSGGTDVALPGPCDDASATVGSTVAGRFCSGAAIRSTWSAARSAARSAGSVVAPATSLAFTWRAPSGPVSSERPLARAAALTGVTSGGFAFSPAFCSDAVARRGASLSGARSLSDAWSSPDIVPATGVDSSR
jgi:hypothetical protein